MKDDKPPQLNDMKNTIQLCLMMVTVPLFTLSQNSVFLSDPVQVANNSDYGRTRPRVTTDGDGNPVVMWGRSNTDQVYVNTWNPSNDSFNDPVKITLDGMTAFVSSWAGPDIASYGDTVYVTYHSTPEATGKSYVHRSVDGGATFGDTVRVDAPSVQQSRFPSVAVTDEGNPVVGFMKFEGNWIDPQYTVANSYDNGLSFDVDVVASELAPGEVCDCCPAQVITNGTDQAMMFRNNDGDLRDNWVSFSEDDGITYDNALDVDINDWIINSCPSSGPDGYFDGDTLYTVWMSEGSGEIRVNIASVNKTNGMIGYTGNMLDWSLLNGSENFPRIAGNGQTMGVVFQAWNDGNTDCFITASTTGISGLVDTLKLGGIETSGIQRNPDIAYGGNAFHVVYEDIDTGHLMYQYGSISNVGIEDQYLESNIWNSGTGEIRVKVAGSDNVSYAVYNQLGSVVKQSDSTENEFTITGLERGLYHVKLSNGLGQGSTSLYVN